MKAQELLENIKNGNFDIATALEVKTYLPIKQKQMIAQLIINECTEQVNGVIKLDSMKQYLSYVKYMIKFYTNLEYTDDDYDALCGTEYGETTLVDAIMSCYLADAKECSRILNLMLDDYMRENSIEVSIGKFMNSLTNTVNGISEKIGNFDMSQIIPEGIDIDKFNGFLEQYVK